MNIKSAGMLSTLSDAELDILIQWGNTHSYKLVTRLLDEYGFQHLKQLINKPLTKDSLLELSERRGRFMEGKKILSLPLEAKDELKSRRKE